MPLYPASAKFACDCGWAAFESCYEGAIKMRFVDEGVEDDGAYTREYFDLTKIAEIICSRCEGHLGHLFGGEGKTSTNERHCTNSLAIRYDPKEPPTAFRSGHTFIEWEDQAPAMVADCSS